MLPIQESISKGEESEIKNELLALNNDQQVRL